MKKIISKCLLLVVLSMVLISCNNTPKEIEITKNPFELIQYPKWMDTIDCIKYGMKFKPYPCLGLHSRTMYIIDSIYDSPIYTRIDTLYYGKEKIDEFIIDYDGVEKRITEKHYTYDDRYHNVSKVLSKIPIAKVTYTYRKAYNNHFYLYFISNNNEDVVFWGEMVEKFME